MTTRAARAGILVVDTSTGEAAYIIAEALHLRFPNIMFVVDLRGTFEVRTATATIGAETLQRIHEAASMAVCAYRAFKLRGGVVQFDAAQ